MIYSSIHGVASGITKAVNRALLLCTTTGQTASRFLDGTPKVITLFWEGDPIVGTQEDFEPERGDGRVEILYPGCAGYVLPPHWNLQDAACNIRAGVPMWLLKSGDEHQPEPYVLGMGVLHPRWSSATLDLYCSASRDRLCRTYFGDPRRDFNQPQPNWPSIKEQKAQIAEAGGMPRTGPDRAPRHPGFLGV